MKAKLIKEDIQDISKFCNIENVIANMLSDELTKSINAEILMSLFSKKERRKEAIRNIFK